MQSMLAEVIGMHYRTPGIHRELGPLWPVTIECVRPGAGGEAEAFGCGTGGDGADRAHPLLYLGLARRVPRKRSVHGVVVFWNWSRRPPVQWGIATTDWVQVGQLASRGS